MKNCLECNESITAGRSDKKFCCDLCRNSYNNQKAEKEKSTEMVMISIILRKNRKILAQMIKQPPKQLRKENLLQQGFNFYYSQALIITKAIIATSVLNTDICQWKTAA